MLALINRILDWIKSLFWKEEMELTLVGLQYSGKTTFVNVIAVCIITKQSLYTKTLHLYLFYQYLIKLAKNKSLKHIMG